MTRGVLPTERSLLQGLVIARWASWVWMAGLVVMAWGEHGDSSDRLDQRAAAVGVLPPDASTTSTRQPRNDRAATGRLPVAAPRGSHDDATSG